MKEPAPLLDTDVRIGEALGPCYEDLDLAGRQVVIVARGNESQAA